MLVKSLKHNLSRHIYSLFEIIEVTKEQPLFTYSVMKGLYKHGSNLNKYCETEFHWYQSLCKPSRKQKTVRKRSL